MALLLGYKFQGKDLLEEALEALGAGNGEVKGCVRGGNRELGVMGERVMKLDLALI